MMLIYADADFSLDITSEYVNTVVIENRQMFAEMITALNDQINGLPGKLVLSNDFVPQSIKDKILLITQFVPFTVNQKDLLSKLYAKLKKEAMSAEMYVKTQEYINYSENYIYELLGEDDGEYSLTEPYDITGLLKMFGLCFNDIDMTLPQKILEYTMCVNEFLGDHIFVFVNLRSYIDDETIQQLFRSFVDHGIMSVIIENKEYTCLTWEKRTIIDDDCCII